MTTRASLFAGKGWHSVHGDGFLHLYENTHIRVSATPIIVHNQLPCRPPLCPLPGVYPRRDLVFHRVAVPHT